MGAKSPAWSRTSRLLTSVAADLERLACAHPERFLAWAMRIRRRLHEALPVIVAFLLVPLLGCTTASILTPVPLHAAGDLERTRAAIMNGMSAAGWEYMGGEGHAVYARLRVRSSTADVAISYDEQSIRFAYRGSDRLRYDPKSHKIHKVYNLEVARLRAAVASAVTRVEGGDYPVKIEPAP